MTTAGVLGRPATAHPITAGDSIAPADFALVRRELLLRHCKWDPQVGDVTTLANFPLRVNGSTWRELATIAEQLTIELLAAEQELWNRPELYQLLDIPRALRSMLGASAPHPPTPAAVRTMRFDFHWTRDGWRISEVNSDVPGGFCEATEFARLMAALDGSAPAGNPADRWANSLCARAATGIVALLAAPGFMEDVQVVSYLARVLHARGVNAEIARPQELRWESGRAHLRRQQVGAIVRFYQAEWLSGLPAKTGWRNLMVGGATPVTNPSVCVFGESKRFPLTWNHLHTDVSTWRRYLPETRSPRGAPWQTDDSWLLKSAWCNTGDSVSARTISTPKAWTRATWSAMLWPRQWVAQRRFEPVAVPSPMGDIYPCVGVFVIDGRACGAYTRISTRPVIDYRATDAALVVREELW